MKSVYDIINKSGLISELQPTTCNDSMILVYDKIKGKTIDISKMSYVDEASPEPDVGIAKWYNYKNLNVEFWDRRDSVYDYFIGIKVGGEPTFPDPNCCKQNPVQNCICQSGTNKIFCIVTFTMERAVPTNITFDVPLSVIDDAISTLPTVSSSNLVYYVLGGAVLIGMIYFTKRNRS